MFWLAVTVIGDVLAALLSSAVRPPVRIAALAVTLIAPKSLRAKMLAMPEGSLWLKTRLPGAVTVALALTLIAAPALTLTVVAPANEVASVPAVARCAASHSTLPVFSP